MIQWRFPSNDFGETKGINDSGVATFRGTPLKSLAREICQNSLDAARSKTVLVEFDLFHIPTNEVPGVDALRDAFERSLDFWKSMKGGSTREFFESAIRTIDKPKCAFLRISDHNTTGLLGSRAMMNTDWVNLTKAAGASDKLGTAGGSYGIGKYAPFACSDLSTVFYSTYDANGEKAYQGVSRLVTFEDANGDTTQGTGYYGNEKNTPVFEELQLKSGYCRAADDYGTDIYISGYKYDNGDWQAEIIVSLLDSFLGAIWREQLVVHVGSVVISKATLPNVIEEYRNRLLDNTADYYETIVSEQTQWIDYNFPGLGEVKFGVLLGNSEAPRKVAMIRKTGMKILDRGRISSVPFTGVLFINGEKLNQRLRAMENPEHTQWQPDRIVANPTGAKMLLSSINAFLRDTIQKLVYNGDTQEMDAAGAGAFLPDEDPDAKDKAKEEVVEDKVQDVEKKVKHAPKPIPDPAKDPDDKEEVNGEGDGEHRVRGGDLEGDADSDGDHDGHGGHEGEHLYHWESGGEDQKQEDKNQKKAIALQKFLPICIDKSKGIYVIAVAAVEKCGNCNLELYLSAETGCYEAPVLEAVIPPGNKLVTEGHIIKGLKLEAGTVVRIKVKLDYFEMCSMEVKAYEIEE